MPNNKINYITPEEYSTLLKHGLKYKGYVIGVGYAYITTAVIPPPTMDILNPPKFVPHGMDHYLHLKVQCLNTSDEAIKLSFKGNVKPNKKEEVEEGKSGGGNPYNLANETFYKGMALGATFYLADAPQPGPGDAAGAIYQASTIVTAGVLFAGTYFYLHICDIIEGNSNHPGPWSYERPNNYIPKSPQGHGNHNIPNNAKWAVGGALIYKNWEDIHKNTIKTQQENLTFRNDNTYYFNQKKLYGF